MGKNKIVKLGLDLAQGRMNFSEYNAQDGNEAMRLAFRELMGYADNGEAISAKAFRRHKVEIFEILEEIVDVTVEEGLRGQLDGFVEYRNLALGDKNMFKVPANKLFRVSMISDGNGNMRRQRMIDGQEYSVGTDTYGVKIYEEFNRFLAGRIDWAEMVRLVAESFQKDIKDRINLAILDHFTEVGADGTYRLTKSGVVPTEREILTMVKHVETKTGEKVTIYGTAVALNQLEVKYPSDADYAQRNQTGYFGKIAGIDCVEIENSHKVGTDEFVFEDDFILLLPQTQDKMCKVVNEGVSHIQESTGGDTASMELEYSLTNKFGISIIASKQYGYIKFTA